MRILCANVIADMKYGYARVSTDRQNLDSQLGELKAAGCLRIFQEKVSGARSDRPELAKLVGKLGEGDTLVVCRLDRLARSTRDLLTLLDDVAGKGASFHSLKDHWANTDTAHGKLMLTILGGLAEFERSLIISRTSEGREHALRNGIKFGRKPKLTSHQRGEALARRNAGEPLITIVKSYNVSHSTISRL